MYLSVCVSVSASSALGSTHLEFEALELQLLCSSLVTDEQRIAGQWMRSGGSFRQED